MENQFTVALAGNPNTGKSTIFNYLTGARQHVGNWPGKTVEKKEGIWKNKSRNIIVVDLPGTYSLTAFSLEEVIARDFIIEQKPHLVVVVVDAANLERNLYLTIQVIELGARVIVALNMSDIAQSRGIKINVQKLSDGLQVPVIPTIASKEKGLEDLKTAILNKIAEFEEEKNDNA